MKLPNCQNARIPQRKLTHYLLSDSHRNGKHKAAFFARYGFSARDWHVLAMALGEHATRHEVAAIEESPFGTRYVVDGIMSTPDGREPKVRSVWFIEAGESVPRFVTAYPLRRSST